MCLCLLVCRARIFLTLTELLTQNSIMADFYLGNSLLISRSAKQPLGQPAATHGRALVLRPDLEIT